MEREVGRIVENGTSIERLHGDFAVGQGRLKMLVHGMKPVGRNERPG
jgi:hypothetical protein